MTPIQAVVSTPSHSCCILLIGRRRMKERSELKTSIQAVVSLSSHLLLCLSRAGTQDKEQRSSHQAKLWCHNLHTLTCTLLSKTRHMEEHHEVDTPIQAVVSLSYPSCLLLYSACQEQAHKTRPESCHTRPSCDVTMSVPCLVLRSSIEGIKKEGSKHKTPIQAVVSIFKPSPVLLKSRHTRPGAKVITPGQAVVSTPSHSCCILLIGRRRMKERSELKTSIQAVVSLSSHLLLCLSRAGTQDKEQRSSHQAKLWCHNLHTLTCTLLSKTRHMEEHHEVDTPIQAVVSLSSHLVLCFSRAGKQDKE